MNKINHDCKIQTELDKLYKKFVVSLTGLQDDDLRLIDVSKNLRKCYNNFKPYWSEELSSMWKKVKQKKLVWLKYKSRQTNTDFINERDAFDNAKQKELQDI